MTSVPRIAQGWRVLPTLALALAVLAPIPTPAEENAVETIKIVYLTRAYPDAPPLSLVLPQAREQGVAGARVAIGENNKTGAFVGKRFELIEDIVGGGDDVAAEAKRLLASGLEIIVADLEPADLLGVADLPQARGAVLLDVRTSDDSLRARNCRASVFHLLPNWRCAPTHWASSSPGSVGPAGF